MATTTRNRLSQAQKLAVIEARKRSGDITKIAGKTGFSTSHVSNVLNGRHANEQIVNTAYTLVSQRKA
jgi:hypothetical protein